MAMFKLPSGTFSVSADSQLKGAFAVLGEPVHLVSHHFAQGVRVIPRVVEKGDPILFDAHLFEKALSGLDADIRPEVALCQTARALGAGHDRYPPSTPFQGVHDVLHIHFAGAGELLDLDLHIFLSPLAGHLPRLRDAVGTYIKKHIWRIQDTNLLKIKVFLALNRQLQKNGIFLPVNYYRHCVAGSFI
jgi:hypothetical protein